MTGAFLLGLDRPTAARFSFLLSVPAVGGAGLYELYSERAALLATGQLGGMVAGVVSAAVVGYLTIGGLLRFLRTHSTMSFVVYRVALAGVLIGLMIGGYLTDVPA
jgi:undecaprenyl-diphosphatase